MISLAYYPGWAQKTIPPAALPWDALTSVCHFGRYPTSSGTLPVADMQSEGFHGPLVAAARAHGATALLTIGGGGSFNGQTIGANFAAACSSGATRSRLVTAAAGLVGQYGYDGLDLDWEESVPDHADAYLALLEDLRDALGPGRLLTAAVVSGLVPGRIAARAAAVVDRWHLMSYWSDGTDQLGHYTTAGIHPSRCLLGAGFSADPEFADKTAADVAAKVAAARAGGAGGVMFWQIGDLTPGPSSDPRLQPLREATRMALDLALLPDILRGAGLRVGIVPDFSSNGHGTANPGGHLLHHTAGNGLQAVYAWPGRWGDARPDVPSPRCNLWWPRTPDSASSGMGNDVWCVTSGMAYHAGAGSSVALEDILAGRISAGVGDAAARGLADEANTPGNPRLIGHEVENLGTPADPYPPDQLARLARGVHAINVAAGWTSRNVGHHRQYTARKPDMSYRGDIWAAIDNPQQEDAMSQADIDAINAHTDAQVAELTRILTANLGPSSVNNPNAWTNAGIGARIALMLKAAVAPLTDDESHLTAMLEAARTDIATSRADLAAAIAAVQGGGAPPEDPKAYADAVLDDLANRLIQAKPPTQ
jgi:Glycosyl hydrolases family 18/N-acetylmuramoyl-L-alanine amidase